MALRDDPDLAAVRQPVEAQPPASSRSAAPMYWLIALMGLLIVGGIYYIADAFAG